MNVSSRDLAVGLARGLDGAAPDGLSVRAVNGNLEVRSGVLPVGGSAALEILQDDAGTGPTADRIETATRAALAGIQDVIIESTRSPWPRRSADNGTGNDLPQPDCRVRDAELLAWFGDEATPALALPAIRFP
jgi:hypothetical protein